MASIVKATNWQSPAGVDYFVDGYPRRPGQIIEYLSSPCDGSTITGLSGSYVFPNVTTQQTTTTAYADITGSSIAYTPPAGTSRVIYKFDYAMRWEQDHAITHAKFFIDSNEVVYARHSRSGRYPEDRVPFEWTINIGGAANTNTGRLESWTSPKTLKMQIRRYGDSNARNLHGTTYWDGGASNQFSMPSLTIIAIA